MTLVSLQPTPPASFHMELRLGCEGLQPLVEKVMREPEWWADMTIVRQRVSATVARADSVVGPLYVKLYNQSLCLSDPWPCMFGSRARHEQRALSLLTELVGNPIKTLAWADKPRRSLRQSSLIITPAWASAVDLREFYSGLRSGRYSDSQREHLLAALPFFMRRLRGLHEQGVSLNDSYDKNILLRFDLAPERSLAWIDQPRLVQGRRPLAWSARLRDFACLDKGAVKFLTEAERWRAFRAYNDSREGPPLTGSELRSWLRALAERRVRMEHDTPLRRPLRRWRLRFNRWYNSTFY